MSIIEDIRSTPPQRISTARGLRRSNLRSVVRSVLLSALAGYQQIAVKPDLGCRVDILLLHTVFPDEEANFRKLVESLASEYRFISYSEAVSKIRQGDIQDRYLAFSFDDGQKCCLSAARILEEFGARACFFVCPDIISETSSDKVETFCRERLLHGPVDFLDWDDLTRLKDAGHEIGGHTINHIDLAVARQDQVSENLSHCRNWILRELGECAHFAWPYGRFRNVTVEAIASVFEAGYESCASGERGTNRAAAISETQRHSVLRRQSIEAIWPKSHVRYFLNREYQSNPFDVI